MNKQEKSRFDQLYQKHLDTLKLQGKAEKTIDAYGRAVRRIATRLDCCPDTLTQPQLEAYFLSLVESHSWSTVKLDRNGLRFFFEETVGREMPWLNLIKAPPVKPLPDMLTHVEIAQIIRHTRQLRYQTFWCVTYTLGLRLSECLHLEVSDIDRHRQQVHVRRGKGNKDRFVTLPALTHRVLQRYWVSHRHPRLIFPGRPALEGAPAPKVMDRGTTQRAFKRAVVDCGIHKRLSIHSLRRAYATHLIEAGLHLRGIQELLGHANPNTTARYVRMTEKTQEDSSVIIASMVETLATALRQLKPKSQGAMP